MSRRFSRTTTLGFGVALALVFASVSPVLAGYITTSSDRVEAFETDEWTVRVPAGRSTIHVRGDGDTDLDCFAYDRFGRRLDSDEDSTDHCILNVRQATAGSIRVEIHNLGSVYNAYDISVE